MTVGVVVLVVHVIPTYLQSFSLSELNMLNKTGFVKAFQIYSFLVVNKNTYISIEQWLRYNCLNIGSD